MIKTILIVDDSPISRKMLKSCIPKDMGYELHEAGNGKEGVEKYQSLKPEVTFMDLTMPVMNGYEAVEKIIELDKNALIIVVTADILVKAITKVLDLGAYMDLKKAIKKNDIHNALIKAEDTLQKFA
jgi:two-component system chemotaxis response regulator CheY